MKRLLSVILSVVLMLACIPVFASAGNSVTVSSAEELINAVENAGENETVYLRGGFYRFGDVLSFENCRKGLRIASCEGETAVITNSLPVTGWEECTINGRSALCTDAGGKTVSALFGEGGQLPVSRLPEAGYWHILKADLSDTKGEGNDLASNGFYISDLKKAPANMQDVTVQILHQWVSETDRMVSFDESTGLVKLPRYSGRPIEQGDRYYLLNAAEGLDKAGEWCFDSKQDKIFYIPKEGENAENLTLFASANPLLLNIDNSSDITFERVKFADTGFTYSDDKYLNMNIHTRLRDHLQSSVQGAVDVCGAVDVTYSENIAFRNCAFENMGVNALRLYTGAKNCTVDSCTFDNTGANAVLTGGRFFFGEGADNRREDYAENITVTNCEISNYGRIFHGACGITVTYCDTADISHNEIHDGYYTGISAGFTWLFFDNPTCNISIRDNLIYNIGLKTLSDMGGIYMLGIQQGTVVSGNVIHDVYCYPGEGGYAGEGIYLDSGSEYMTIENNLVFNCSTSAFNTTLSRYNTIRNNIFAFGGQSTVSLGEQNFAQYKDLNNTWLNNILLTGGKAITIERIGSAPHFNGRSNILWDASYGDELYFTTAYHDETADTLATTQKRGLLGSAVVTDPGFSDVYAFDFTFRDDSEAVKLGFEPFDYSAAGTLKGSTVGLEKEGGKTPYNAGVKPVVPEQANPYITEKIKAFFENIIEKIREFFASLFGTSKASPSDLYTTGYSADEVTEEAEEVRRLLDGVKNHTPTYRVDESRKPFADDDRIKAVYFDGEQYEGRDTEVFAYIGFPENASETNPVPAMVLIHGGGVHAQADWVQYWVDHGYAAISYDGFGQQPVKGYYSVAGGNNPDWPYNPASHAGFTSFSDIDTEYSQQWFYYYIADAILSNNILRADKRVVASQIGVSGISWGGLAASFTVTCDDRFAWGIPIYGCACWEKIDGFFSAGVRKIWDPTPLLKDVKMPVLFVNGDADPFFHADATSVSAALVPNGTALLVNGLMHAEFRIDETVRFANEQTGRGQGNINITGLEKNGNRLNVSFTLPGDMKDAGVTLYYRSTPLEYSGTEIKDEWQSRNAVVIGNDAAVTIPKDAIMYYVCVSAGGSVFSRDEISATSGIFNN